MNWIEQVTNVYTKIMNACFIRKRLNNFIEMILTKYYSFTSLVIVLPHVSIERPENKNKTKKQNT